METNTTPNHLLLFSWPSTSIFYTEENLIWVYPLSIIAVLYIPYDFLSDRGVFYKSTHASRNWVAEYPLHQAQLLNVRRTELVPPSPSQSLQMIDNAAHGGRQTSALISQVGSAGTSCQWRRAPCLVLSDQPRCVWQHHQSGVIILESALRGNEQSCFFPPVGLFIYFMCHFTIPGQPKCQIQNITCTIYTEFSLWLK